MDQAVIYRKLAGLTADPRNSEILEEISEEEREHYEIFKSYTGRGTGPRTLRIWFFLLLSRIFGLTFVIKQMERFEDRAQVDYRELAGLIPEAETILKEEEEHEKRLIEMISERRLEYIGDILRGLNAALVEKTGELAGLTLVLKDPGLVAVVVLITGMGTASALAGTEYLVARTERGKALPAVSSYYSGLACMATVALLVAPYLLISDIWMSFGVAVAIGALVILVFTYYVSVVFDHSFWKRFVEMGSIGLGVGALVFIAGYALEEFLHVGHV